MARCVRFCQGEPGAPLAYIETDMQSLEGQLELPRWRRGGRWLRVKLLCAWADENIDIDFVVGLRPGSACVYVETGLPL